MSEAMWRSIARLFAFLFVLSFTLTSSVVVIAQEADSAAVDSSEGDDAAAEGTETASIAPGAASIDPDYVATTTGDILIPLDQLRILVKPLTKAELQVEADAWFKLLRQKAKQIAAVQLSIRAPDEASAVEPETEPQAEQSPGSDATAETNEATTPQSDDSTGDSDGTGAGNEQAMSQNPAATLTKDQLLTQLNRLQDQRTAISDRLEVVLYSLEAKGGEVEEYRNYMIAVSGIDLVTTDASATWTALVGWLKSREGGQRWAWNVLKFVLILLATMIIASLIARITNWLLASKVRLSQLAENLIARTVKNVVLVIGLAVALTALEIDVTPILAAIGAAGFIVGFALQGTLSNFASGLMILVNRPFDVGNVVTAGGVTGTIHQMNLVSTTFRTFDNQTIHVPNNEIWGNVITNITANETRRVDLEFGIGYDDDFEKAESIIRDVVTSHELVLAEPVPEVVTHALADSSVNIVCRPWAKTSDWWRVKTDVVRRVKQRFDEAGISIPYPQRDIHVHQIPSSD